MAYLMPADHILRGLYFEKSGLDHDVFFVWAFVLPLCVPQASVSFNFGFRLHGPDGEGWSFNKVGTTDSLKNAIRSQALPFLEKCGSNFITLLRDNFSTEDIHRKEALSYLLVLSGDLCSAESAFKELFAALDINVKWHEDILARAELLSGMLKSDYPKARKQLGTWEGQSKSALGIA